MTMQEKIIETYFSKSEKVRNRRIRLLLKIANDYPYGFMPTEIADELEEPVRRIYNDLAMFKQRGLIDVPSDDDNRGDRRKGVATSFGNATLTSDGEQLAEMCKDWKL